MTESSAQKPSEQSSKAPEPNLMQHVTRADSWLRSAASLTVVTFLAGLFGTYIQYLNAYEDKVRDRAKADMTEATSTFIEISKAFADAQTLQELVYFNFKDALGKRDASSKLIEVGKPMAADVGRATFKEYVKARTALREKRNIYARQAELYIDWASDLARDPAAKHDLSGDRLTDTLLGTLNFDCDTEGNMPHFKANATVDVGKPPQITIDWHSAKHHVVTMYYCFDKSHRDMESARMWAAGAEIGPEIKEEFEKKAATIKTNLDNQVVRLNAFMSLAMSQLERIRVKYRPSSFYCSVPVVSLIFGNQCTPVRVSS